MNSLLLKVLSYVVLVCGSVYVSVNVCGLVFIVVRFDRLIVSVLWLSVLGVMLGKKWWFFISMFVEMVSNFLDWGVISV